MAISVIICSVTPARFEAVRDNLRALLAPDEVEFLHIADATSIAEGYNRGVRQSRGDVLILCHDDVEILARDFRDRLLARLERFDLLGVAGSSRVVGPAWVRAGPPDIFGQVAHEVAPDTYDVLMWGVPARCVGDIQVMDGLFLAGHRRVFESVPFDERTFTDFHLYDLDFTLRAAQAGFRLAVCNDFMVIHASQGHFDQRWAAEAEKFVKKHADSLEPIGTKKWAAMQVRVQTREEVVDLLAVKDWPVE